MEKRKDEEDLRYILEGLIKEELEDIYRGDAFQRMGRSFTKDQKLPTIDQE